MQDHDIISGEIYLIHLPYEANLVVRKVYANGTGLILNPENDKYETIILSADEITEETIQGRVMWYLSRRALRKDDKARD
jgi:SOS-response transcriptional repressor LexA